MTNIPSNKIGLKPAFKFAIWGMLISVLWILVSIVLLSIFKQSAIGELIRTLNAPLVYQVSEKIFYFFVNLGLVNKHNAILFFLFVFIVYASIGYISAFFGYFICRLIKPVK